VAKPVIAVTVVVVVVAASALTAYLAWKHRSKIFKMMSAVVSSVTKWGFTAPGLRTPTTKAQRAWSHSMKTHWDRESKQDRYFEHLERMVQQQNAAARRRNSNLREFDREVFGSDAEYSD
jgi:hypothetical protein